MGMSTGWSARRPIVGQHQLALLGGHADHGERAALALAEGLELRQRLGRDRQHVALLALVAPDFLGRQAGLFQRHGAQVEARAAAGVVGQLGEGVGEPPAPTSWMARMGLPRPAPAVVDDLLRAALDLGVAALHRVEVQLAALAPLAIELAAPPPMPMRMPGPPSWISSVPAGNSIFWSGARRCCRGRRRS
jgi:hypothetical protein